MNFITTILLWLDGNIASPVRYSYLLISPDDNADILATPWLILYYTFSPLILSSIFIFRFFIFFIFFFHFLSKGLFPSREELCDKRVVSITKKGYGFAVHFLQRFIKSWKSIYHKLLN